jgi:fluoride exporter
VGKAPMTDLLAVAVGAAVGAPLRWFLNRRFDLGWPWGTFVANVLGSFLLGCSTALAVDGWRFALLAIGFCGGLTTYSSFAVQTHALGWRRGGLYAAITIVLSVAGATLGFVLF